MSGAHEALERAEHAAHSGSHGSSGKHMGLTMAMLGVLIAFSAAMVGGERNELTRTMIEQTQAHSDYSAASTKFRLVMMEIEKLRSVPGSLIAADGIPSTLAARFVQLYSDYASERALSKSWSDRNGTKISGFWDEFWW